MKSARARIAILANDRDSFVRPTADGLQRMLEECGADAEVRYDGLHHLGIPTSVNWSSARSFASTSLKLVQNRQQLDRFIESIRNCDAVVVVAHVPSSFSRVGMSNLEMIRKRLPAMPIVNYDLIYLPTVEKWGRAILHGEETGLGGTDMDGLAQGMFGMDRYDWYLAVSTASEIPMPSRAQPLTTIGIHLDDGSLFPEQGGELRALVDFAQERKDYPSYRATQLRALDQTGIPYDVLEGTYTSAEIRAIYRRTGIFMLAHRESFGLPICELQACGSLIFTPHAEWAGAHWMKADQTLAGPGTHSPNFRVYDNNFDKLVAQLEAAKREFDPAAVVANFDKFQPQLFRGDAAAARRFVGMIESGTIHGALHRQHKLVGRESMMPGPPPLARVVRGRQGSTPLSDHGAP